eukprot:COSAG04_NODE_6567_length_1303_cov_1.314784_1_plen_110_part_00
MERTVEVERHVHVGDAAVLLARLADAVGRRAVRDVAHQHAEALPIAPAAPAPIAAAAAASSAASSWRGAGAGAGAAGWGAGARLGARLGAAVGHGEQLYAYGRATNLQH